MESVRVLVATAARVNDLTDELKAAQRDHKNAWQRAIKQGWSAEELRRTGLTDPTTRRPPRRKPAAQTSTERSVEQPAQSPEH